MIDTKIEYILRQRELGCCSNRVYHEIPFHYRYIRHFSHISKPLTHSGCINTAKWSQDGCTLVTGSDDCNVKIWDTRNFENLTLQKCLKTSHYGNIFCAELMPMDKSICLSCGADGRLLLNNVLEQNGETVLLTSPSIMHSFMYSIHNSKVVYTAEECGVIRRVDLRSKVPEVIYNHKVKVNNITVQAAVKSMFQATTLLDTQAIIGGSKSRTIGLIDFRYIPDNPNLTTRECYVKSWKPDVSSIYDVNYLKGKSDIEATVSGMHVNSNGSSFLVSYQSDQIYSFDIHTPRSICQRPVSHKDMFGGHVNHDTFLKTVSYFGSNDEFVLSGSDGGYIWVWNNNSSTYSLPESTDFNTNHFSRSSEVLTLLKADSRTCNGVIPHPFLPVFVSYGIDSTAKLWSYKDPELHDDDHQDNNRNSLRTHRQRSCYCEVKCQDSDHNVTSELSKTIELSRFDMSIIELTISAPKNSFDSQASKVINFSHYLRTVYAIRRYQKQIYEVQNHLKFTDFGPEYPTDLFYHLNCSKPRFILAFFLRTFELYHSKLSSIHCPSNTASEVGKVDFSVIVAIMREYHLCDIGDELRSRDDLTKFNVMPKNSSGSVNSSNDVCGLSTQFNAVKSLLVYLCQSMNHNDIDVKSLPKDNVQDNVQDNNYRQCCKYYSLILRSVVEIHVYFIAFEAKQNGSNALKDKNYKEAIRLYRKSIRYLESLQLINPNFNNWAVNSHLQLFYEDHILDDNVISQKLKVTSQSMSDKLLSQIHMNQEKLSRSLFNFPFTNPSETLTAWMWYKFKNETSEDSRDNKLKLKNTSGMVHQTHDDIIEIVNTANVPAEEFETLLENIKVDWEDKLVVDYLLMIQACLNNLVMVYMQMNRMRDARACSDRSLEFSKSVPSLRNQIDIKLRYRRGCILSSLEEYSDALNELQIALDAATADTESKRDKTDITTIVKKIKEVKHWKELENKIQIKKYKKMFG